jgi:integration host factor subunit beta
LLQKESQEGDTMNKRDLIDRLAREKEIFRTEAKKVVDLVFQGMAGALAQGDRVEIRDLGSFTVKKYRAYEGRNPKTGAVIPVKPKKLPFFKVGKELKERVNSK